VISRVGFMYQRALERFERNGGCEAPCELIIAAGTR